MSTGEVVVFILNNSTDRKACLTCVWCCPLAEIFICLSHILASLAALLGVFTSFAQRIELGTNETKRFVCGDVVDLCRREEVKEMRDAVFKMRQVLRGGHYKFQNGVAAVL